MRIAFVEIQNFRKLKSCRVELSAEKTVFVGANNSGKTSAMDALMMFLKKGRRKEIATIDFTLSNWIPINKIGQEWTSNTNIESLDLSRSRWEPYLPSLDVWLDVREDDIHHVSHLIPTLDWDGGRLGVRLLFEPKDIEDLYKKFIASFKAAESAAKSSDTNEKSGEKTSKLTLWPRSLRDFLDRELHKHFVVNGYVLDPDGCKSPDDGVASIQKLSSDAIPLDREPFEGLFKIDIINAQRGFSDANAEDTPQQKLRQSFCAAPPVLYTTP